MSRKVDMFFYNLRKNALYTLHPLQNFFIEINTTCNLNCKHCYIPKQFRQSVLSLKDIECILKQIKTDWGDTPGIAITGGEPLLHPSFNEITKILGRYKFRWSLATNGLLLTPKIIDFLLENNCSAITISLDGDENSHEKQRDKIGSYKEVLKVIDLLLQKKFPYICITSTLHDDNVYSLENIYTLISKYRDTISWRINPLLSCENAQQNNLKISKSTYIKICKFVERVKTDFNIDIILGEKNPLSIKYKEYLYSEFDSCFAGISTFGVLANGDIVNCMVCREKTLGNIKDSKSLKSIWDKQDLTQKGLCERHIESKQPFK